MRKYIISYEIDADDILKAQSLAKELEGVMGMSPVSIQERREKYFKVREDIFDKLDQILLAVEHDEMHESVKDGMLKLLTCYEEADFLPEEILPFGRNIVLLEALLAEMKKGGLV